MNTATYESQSKEELITTILELQEELSHLKRMIFGSKRERFIAEINPQQIALDLNVEPQAEVEQTIKEISYTRIDQKVIDRSNHKGRLPLPSHLERVDHELQPQESVEGLKLIGKDITEVLEYKPGKLYVNRYIRPKYARPDGEGIVMASLPSRAVEKSIAGNSLLSYMTVSKYVDHLPLHRQRQMFKREKVNMALSTMTDMIKNTAEAVTPLYELLKDKVFESDYIMADETPIDVLEPEKKGANHQGYYWVYRSIKNNLVLFDYRPGRGRDGPSELLKNFKGYLQTDGFSVYDSFGNKPGITLMHCMAHARRNFDKARENKKEMAEYVLGQIQLLYKIEQAAREGNYTDEQRYDLRQKDSVKILTSLKEWFLENITRVTPKSAMGQAIGYALERWDRLSLYTTHGMLEIDNNPVENSIRPVAIGKKNYLFAGSHEAAQRGAIIYSFMGTCKIKGINPYDWLTETLNKIPTIKTSHLHELLP